MVSIHAHNDTDTLSKLCAAQRKKIDKLSRQGRAYEQRIAELNRALGELKIELDFCQQS